MMRSEVVSNKVIKTIKTLPRLPENFVFNSQMTTIHIIREHFPDFSCISDNIDIMVDCQYFTSIKNCKENWDFLKRLHLFGRLRVYDWQFIHGVENGAIILRENPFHESDLYRTRFEKASKFDIEWFNHSEENWPAVNVIQILTKDGE
jgi:hypothetical protein